jgi:hypothetical protein
VDDAKRGRKRSEKVPKFFHRLKNGYVDNAAATNRRDLGPF